MNVNVKLYKSLWNKNRLPGSMFTPLALMVVGQLCVWATNVADNVVVCVRRCSLFGLSLAMAKWGSKYR